MLAEVKESNKEGSEKREDELPDCCKSKNEDGKGREGGEGKKSGALSGIVYGLVPHAGCIAFIAASILGVTVATEFFKPLLLNPYFFYGLIALSLVFATLSAALYLRKNGHLSAAGAKRSWKYLSVLYGSTLAVNLLLFMVIFPLAANFAFAPSANAVDAYQPPESGACGLQDAQATLSAACAAGVSGAGAALQTQTVLAKLTLQVDIPCPGHAPLISGELKKLPGVRSVTFRFANFFDVEYDSSKTTQADILGLDVFKTYKATVVN